jgi:hypothetical protein
MGFIAWIIVGLIAGWLAGQGDERRRLRRSRGYHPGNRWRSSRRLDIRIARNLAWQWDYWIDYRLRWSRYSRGAHPLAKRA